MPASRAMSWVVAVAAACLVLQVFGVFRSWLPRAGTLAAVLVAAHLFIARPWKSLTIRRSDLDRHAFAIGLVLLAVLALAVRLPGLNSDLGHVPLDMDEARFAGSVQRFFSSGVLGHETVEDYPGLVFWLFAAASFLGYLRGIVSGVSEAPGQLPLEMFVGAARVANVGIAVVLTIVTAWVGRQFAGRLGGLLAGLIIAVVPLSVGVSGLARNDPGMVLAIVLTVGAALACYRVRRAEWMITAGVLAGVATAIKYSSFVALVPVAIAAFASPEPVILRTRRMAYAFAGFVAAIAVTNHFVWADVPRFLGQLAEQVAITGDSHWAATDNPAWFYVRIMQLLGPGVVWLILAGVFAVAGLSARRPDRWILLSFPLLYVWFMSWRPSQLTRWVLPVLRFVAICGAATLVTVWQHVRARVSPVPSDRQLAVRTAAILVFAAALAQPLWLGAVAFSRVLTPPTHTLAETWLQEHAGQDAQVLLEKGFFDFNSPRFVIQRVPDLLAVLDDGTVKLAGCQFVVVPEGMFDHPTLKELTLLDRVYADESFGGRIGLDYEVFAIPDLPFPPVCAKGEAAH